LEIKIVKKFSIDISPAFHDLDPMNIVWHGNYVKYLEIARCAMLASMDYDIPQMEASGYAWPIVDMRLKYTRPIVYGQIVVVTCEVVEWEHRLKVAYQMHDKATGQLLNKAYTIQVAVDMSTKEMCYQTPQILADCLGVKTNV
jgi:acyl-CoA thioester hydrolase